MKVRPRPSPPPPGTDRTAHLQPRTGAAQRARALLDSLMQEKRWNLEDLYTLNLQQLRKAGGSVVASDYNFYLPELVQAAYPEHDWQRWRFPRVPKVWWADPPNQRRFLQALSTTLDHKSLENWYTTSSSQVMQLGGRPLFEIYGRSVPIMVTRVFSEHKWDMWRFQSVPDGWWTDPSHQRQFLEALILRLYPGPRVDMEQFYKLTSKILTANRGGGLVQAHQGSVQTLLASAFPTHQWIPWKFSQLPRAYWDDKSNIAAYMSWLAKEKGLKGLDGWYQITKATYDAHYGSALIARYNYSPWELARVAFPNHPWRAWEFTATPRHWWDDKQNCLQFCEWVRGEKLNLGDMAGWYTVSTKEFAAVGGSSLLKTYAGSMKAVLEFVYSAHPWEAWKFSTSPRNFWRTRANLATTHQTPSTLTTTRATSSSLTDLVEGMAVRLGLTSPVDWIRISSKDLGFTISKKIRQAGGLRHALEVTYPHLAWSDLLLQSRSQGQGMKRAHQRLIRDSARRAFPNSEQLEDFLVPNSEEMVRLDVYLKPQNLAIEYHGAQHYFDVNTLNESVVQAQRDARKAVVCGRQGISLLEVPHWWDLNLSPRQASKVFSQALEQLKLQKE